MRIYRPTVIAGLSAIALAGIVAVDATRARAAEVPVSELAQKTHVHGLAVDRTDPSRLFIATHHGLFLAGADSKAELVSEIQDFMGFNPHPAEPDRLYASGHPATGGNLGFLASTDRGRTWRQISPGANGPVDFHQMTVSPADPNTIYGAYGGLQVSRDAGKTWEVAGPAPQGLIDIAASATDARTLHAATETGLFISQDAGKSWAAIFEGAPVTLAEATADGGLYAFVIGRGLLRSADGASDFTGVGNDFGDTYLLHLAVDPADPDRMFAATGEGQIMASTDRGRSWSAFGAGG